MSPDDFKRVFRSHPGGVAVITADPGSGPAGLTATSVFSVSAEPPLLVFSVSSTSSTAPAIRAAQTLVIHLLDADQLEVAQRFATSGIDRFADPASWGRLETGEPVLTGARTWIRGQIVNQIEAGGSTVIVVRAVEASPAGDEPSGSPLVYHDRTWHHLGHHSRLGSGYA